MTPKEWREAAGLTQGDVAKMIGRTKGYVSLLENGVRVPSFSILRAYEEISNGSVTTASFQ
jgi:transcriptional regulator with XRE-family HTH domain